MFTILYFLVRIMMYGPKEGSDFSDMMRDLIIDPITFVFAGIMIVAIIATRVMRSKVKRKKDKTVGVMFVVLCFTSFLAEVTCLLLKLPYEKYLLTMIIYLIIAICISSLVFILISLKNGQGVVDGLIDMFDFEMQGIFWIVLIFLVGTILAIPMIFLLAIGAGGGSRSRDDDDFWVWYFFLR